MYTLENQEFSHEGEIYTMKEGVPTGGKHSVPLANIFLTYVLKQLLKESSDDDSFGEMFKNLVKFWGRFIDDIVGIFDQSRPLHLPGPPLSGGGGTQKNLKIFNLVGVTCTYAPN